MLLALDIGNTNITLGVWNGRSWQHQWRLLTNPAQTADEYGIILKMLLQDVGVLICQKQPSGPLLTNLAEGEAEGGHAPASPSARFARSSSTCPC